MNAIQLYTVEATRRNIEEAYGMKFTLEETGTGYIIISTEGNPPIMFMTNKVGALTREGAFRLSEKQFQNDGVVYAQ